ncbi:MAG: DUF3422 family protein [Hyphomonadaceae bacterium]
MEGGGRRSRTPRRHLSAFERHEQYKIIHGRSHRKSPARVGTPALTRHLAFWIPSVGGDDRPFRDRREDWIANIDWFLASFILNAYERWQQNLDRVYREHQGPDYARRLAFAKSLRPMSFNADQQIGGGPCYRFQFFRYTARYTANNDFSKGEVAFEPQESSRDAEDVALAEGDRFETVSFRVFYGVIPVKVRAELHTEYFTLSFTAELDSEDGAAVAPDDEVHRIKEYFEVLSRVAARRCVDQHHLRSRQDESARAQTDVKTVMPACTHLMEKFWCDIEETFIKPALTPTINGPREAPGPRGPQPSLRDRLGKYFTDCRGLVLAVEKGPEEGKLSAWRLATPFKAPQRGSAIDYVGKAKFEDDEAIDIFGALEPIIDAGRQACASAKMRRDARNRPDKRIFEYTVSKVQRERALYVSALGPQPLWEDYHEPLCYFVITRHRHRWQIGRFLDRMNMLGTLRVASLMEYPALNKAGFKLRQIVQRLQTIDPNDRTDFERLNEQFREAQREVGGGGLRNRTERALFYVRNFRAEYKAINFQRVEGFQPYPSFVERRLGQTWDFIAVLNHRAQEIGKRLDALSNEARAAEEYAQGERLEGLQRFAERAASVPIAYYGGHVLEHLLHPWTGYAIWWVLKHVTPIGFMMQPEPEHEHPYLAIYTLLAVVLYFWSVHMFKNAEARAAKSRRAARAAPETPDAQTP